MVIAPAPFPDECLQGYGYRLFSANQVRLKAKTELLPKLSSTTGISHLDLVLSHGNTSYLRFVSSWHRSEPLSNHCDFKTNIGILSGTPITPSAHFCSKCAADDLDTHGITYWRRMHNLPGVEHCIRHRLPLISATKESIASYFPQNAHLALTATPDLDMEDYFRCPAIERFTALSLAALNSKNCFHHTTIAQVILDRFKENYPNSRPHFLDIACESFPRWWLFKHFPSMFQRNTSVTEPVIFSGKPHVATKHYLLALSLLWDDPTDALHACLAAHLYVISTMNNSHRPKPRVMVLVTPPLSLKNTAPPEEAGDPALDPSTRRSIE